MSKILITHTGVGRISTVTDVSDPSEGIWGIIRVGPVSDLEPAWPAGSDPAELEYVPAVRTGTTEDKMGWRAFGRPRGVVTDIEACRHLICSAA